MSHAELEELLGAYALDAVDRDEVLALEAHIPTCPKCSAELAAHREVAGLFAYSGQKAPDGLWDRITASMQETPPELRLDRIRPSMVTPEQFGASAADPLELDAARARRDRRRHDGRPRPWVMSIAAAAAIVVAVLGVEVAHLSNRVNNIGTHTKVVTASGPTMANVRHALAMPGSRKITLDALDGAKTTAHAVITASGVGYVYGEKLTPLSSDRTYQLWGKVGNVAVSYGLLGTNPGIVRFTAGAGVFALAVTDEAAGGVAVSHQNFTVVGRVSPPL